MQSPAQSANPPFRLRRVGAVLLAEAILLPAAAWVAREEARVLRSGRPLDLGERRLATAAGVREPERLRLLEVERIEFPILRQLSPLLRRWGRGPRPTLGLCLRHGLQRVTAAPRPLELLAHECVHTAQYERLGGIQPFLRAYFRQCLTLGYFRAPLEREAVEISRRLSAPA